MNIFEFHMPDKSIIVGKGNDAYEVAEELGIDTNLFIIGGVWYEDILADTTHILVLRRNS